MFDDMKQFLSSDVCLSCEGCCRFDKEKSDWRPKVGEVEVAPIVASLVPKEKISEKDLTDKGGYLKDKLCRGMYACTYFNPEDTTCGIYHNRPFECRFYPFVLTRTAEKKPVVCVHLPCPFVEKTKGTAEYNDYIDYLKEYINTAEVHSLLKQNPHLFGEYLGYESELEWICDVDL